MVDAPAAIVCLIVMIGLFYLLFGRKFKVDEEHKRALMERDEREEIKNPTLLRQSVIMIILVTAGFMLHGSLGIES